MTKNRQKRWQKVTKTILELANELDVTKQAIQYQLKKINKKYLSKRDDGAYLISEEGQDLIREAMGFEMKSSNKDTDKDHQKTDKRGGKDVLEDTITIVQKELEEKNHQIESLQELLKEQQNLLSQQQQLSLQSNQQIQYLQLELSKDSNEQKNDSEFKDDINIVENEKQESTSKPAEKKKGFFSRWFSS